MIPIPYRVHSETLHLSNPSIWTDNTTQTRKSQVEAFLLVCLFEERLSVWRHIGVSQ